MKRTVIMVTVVILAGMCVVGAPRPWLSQFRNSGTTYGRWLRIPGPSSTRWHPAHDRPLGTQRAMASSATRAVTILFFGSGLGKGVVINNATKKATYRVRARCVGRPGVRGGRFWAGLIFKLGEVLDNFINYGMELGAQMTGAAQGAGQGGSISGAINVVPGVWVYQITEAGLAAEIGITGAKYFKDDKLN